MLSILRALWRSRSTVHRSRLHLEPLEDRTVPSAATPSKIGVVRPSASGVAVFSLDNNGDGQFDAGDSVFSFGLNTDHFIVGDWNGNGSDKIGVVRPQANGTDIFALDTNGDGVSTPAIRCSRSAWPADHGHCRRLERRRTSENRRGPDTPTARRTVLARHQRRRRL